MDNHSNTSGTTDEKIDLTVTVIERLADVLKDPTEGGVRKDLSAEMRNECRSTAHEELLTCVQVLASCASFYHGYYEVLNIANRLQISGDESSTKQNTI